MGKRSRPTLFRSSSAWKAFLIISCCSLRRVVVVVTKDFCTSTTFLQYTLNLIIKQQLHNRNTDFTKFDTMYINGNCCFKNTVILQIYFTCMVTVTLEALTQAFCLIIIEAL